MMSEEIIKLLERHFAKDKRQWVTFKELRVGTGYRIAREPNNPEQRIDFWALNCYQTKKFEKIAFEIKVSRSDFLSEIKNPEKRQRALSLSNRFYFAAPKGLIKPEEIPSECGLVEFQSGSTRLYWTMLAPWRDVQEPSWSFLASLARRIIKCENGATLKAVSGT